MAYNYYVPHFSGNGPVGLDNTISMSMARHMPPSPQGWGPSQLIALNRVHAEYAAFRKNQQEVPEPYRPVDPFAIKVRLTIRFFDKETWRRKSELIMKSPATYLYLHNGKSMIPEVLPPPSRKKTTLESLMKRMLENAGSDHGVVTFKIGEDAVEIKANSCIIQSRIGVPLLRDGHREAADMEIILPHISVEVFKVFLQYLYTQQLSDADLKKYAMDLIVLADQYSVPDLYYHVEYYLCWVTQVRTYTRF